MATKQEILSKLAASHEQRISKVLFDLEEDIINTIQEATDGIPLTTQLAIKLRPNLKRLIEQNYLKEGSKIISEYDEVVKGYMDYIRTIPDNLVSPKFKTLTQPDLVLINQLKQLSFSGFENVANRFLDTIANEVYQSAIVGKPFPEMVQNIRGAVNGVYRRSNEAAINRLVDIVEENRYSDDPISKKKFEDARKILHSKYASDIRGENMRKYASQIAHDSIMQFDGQFTKYKGEEAGITSFKYTGTNIITTREFCRTYLNEVRTEEEWRDIFTGNWKGKSGSDPFINRGGYRCRHSFVPYDPAWDDIPEVKEKVGKVKEKPKSKEEKGTFKINNNKFYSSFPNSNTNEFQNIMNKLEGQEISNEKISRFIEKTGMTLTFMSKQVTMKNFRKNEFEKFNKVYQNNIKDIDHKFDYGYRQTDIKTIGEADINGYPKKPRVKGYASPLNNLPLAWIKENDDFKKINPKKIQESTRTTLERTKNNKGDYQSKLIFGEKKNADWSISSGVEAGTEEQVMFTMLHELGHQVHYYAYNADIGQINSVMDAFKFMNDANKAANRVINKNMILTKYGTKNKHEYHAELFTAYATNRKALEEFNKGLVEYMDDLMEKAIKSKMKGH